ncbi:hypothetical protein ACFQ7G_19715 [Streptomyces massasporeus]
MRNNSARVYEELNYAKRGGCVTLSVGSIHDLRGYNLNAQTRSLKINRNDYDCPLPGHSRQQAAARRPKRTS